MLPIALLDHIATVSQSNRHESIPFFYSNTASAQEVPTPLLRYTRPATNLNIAPKDRQ